MRALLYLRVSTPGQAEGFSLVTQREACERRARELGAGEILCLEDTYTGLELDRPALRRLREHVAARDLDLVVAYDPDRLSRDLGDLLALTREIDSAGVRLEFVNFGWEKSPQGMLFLQMRGAIAQFEHSLIRERTQRGKLKKAALGKLRTGARPYGYAFDPRADELRVDPYQAAVVRRIFRWYALDGLSSHAIARRLAAEGVAAPRGGAWYPATVSRLLGSETYAGRLRRKDERPEWQPVLTPAIIDRGLWERAQEARRRRRPGGRARGRRYLLHGLLRCGLCGRRLHGAARTRGQRAWTYYVCPGRYRRAWGPAAAGACRLRPVPCGRLDGAVWAAVSTRLGDLGADLSLWQGRLQGLRAEALARAQDELSTVSEGRARLARARQRAHGAYLSGLLEEDEYRRLLEGLKAQEARASLEAGRLEAVLEAGRLEAVLEAGRPQAALESLDAPGGGGPAAPGLAGVPRLLDVRRLLAELPWQGRRDVLAAVITEVQVFPGRALVITPLALPAGGAAAGDPQHTSRSAPSRT